MVLSSADSVGRCSPDRIRVIRRSILVASTGKMSFKQSTCSRTTWARNRYDWLQQVARRLSTTTPGAGTFPRGRGPNGLVRPRQLGHICGAERRPEDARQSTRYVIHRMCTEASTAYNGTNAGVANQCGLYVPVTSGSAGGSMSVGSATFEGIPQIYYRITTRVDGPRNTISIIQVSVLVQA